jgi:signal transduction histidine kinase
MSGGSDDLATVISDLRHDTNNSLMAILGYVELLLKRDDLPAVVVSKLKGIQSEAGKIRDHIARTSVIKGPGA